MSIRPRAVFTGLTVLALLVPAHALAQTGEPSQLQEVDYVELAQVLEILSTTKQNVPGTDTPQTIQTLRAKVLDGPDKGAIVTVENDYLDLAVGDKFYAVHSVGGGEAVDERWNVQEPYRLPTLVILAALFLLVVCVFGGRQGVRGLLSLVASLGAIFWILIPGILAGYSPIVLSVVISSLIVGVGSYITHGVSRTTSAAVLGMSVTICVTGALAYWAVYGALLSGYSTEDITYLHFATNGTIDLVGLLLGGIIIGLLGILYDAAIGQAVAVEELARAAAHYTPWELYKRAERIGREHIGALVNTLAIAYVGVSLPLLLLLHFSNLSLTATINQEIFATELVRMMIGSIGLILAVPITTAIAIFMLRGRVAPHGGPTAHAHTH